MVEENKQAAAQEAVVAAGAANGAPAKVPIPISEPSVIHRKIPKTVFLEDCEAWIERYGEDDLFAQMNELHQKYKFMEN